MVMCCPTGNKSLLCSPVNETGSQMSRLCLSSFQFLSHGSFLCSSFTLNSHTGPSCVIQTEIFSLFFSLPPSPPPPSSSVQQSWPHSNRGNEQHLVRLIPHSCKQCKLTAVSGISSSSGVEKKSITHSPSPHLLILASALVLQDNCPVHFPENILESHPLYRAHSSMQM